MRIAAGFASGSVAGPRAWAGLILASFLLAACSGAGSDQADGNSKPRPPAVVVAPVVERSVNAGQAKVARTRAVHRVQLKARVKGSLEKRAFDAGAKVEQNQLLFVIEPDQYAADAAAATATVAEARAAYEKASQYLRRLKSVKRGGVSASDLEKAGNEVKSAKARLDQARAKQKSAELQLGYTKIHAPIGGRISETQVDTGNLIGPDSGVLATIVQMDPIYVEFTVSEREATRSLLRRRKDNEERPEIADYRLRLRLSDGSLYDQTGRLDYVANEVDRSTGTLAVRAIFDNPNGLLRPGQFVTALITGAAPQKRLVVPQAAVQQDKKGHYVFVVDGEGRVARRAVQLGERRKVDWVVKSGLRTGERVIFQGIQKVRPGMTVDAQSGDPSGGLDKPDPDDGSDEGPNPADPESGA